MSQLSPICLFTYNRFSETQQTIKSLQNNYLSCESKLIIFSDGGKNKIDQLKVDLVRKYIKSISGFKSVMIIQSPTNKGLAKSIIDGVSQILKEYSKVIVLEDDLITSPNFLNFMNQALEFYTDEINIQSISGYSLALKTIRKDIYFQIRPGSWGWGTWKDRWNPEIFNKENLKKEIAKNSRVLKQFKLSCGADMQKMLMDSIINKNDSWYVRWAYDHFKQKHYSVFPTYSFIENIGHQVNATHCKGINSYITVPIDNNKTEFNFPDFQSPDSTTTKDFLNYFSLSHKISFRIKLLKNKSGRDQLFQELKMRL